MDDAVKVNLYFPKDLLLALKKLAAAQDLPYAHVVRKACRDYVVANAPRVLEEKRTMEALK